jgi:transposase
MVRQETWMDIKTLKAQGHSQRTVARILGLHRDTVRRVWDEAIPRKYERKPRPTKLDSYLEHLKARLGACAGLRAVRLFREIREQGYSGGYEAVKVYCRAWRKEWRARQGTVRFETSPGVQAQADWGESRDVRFADGSIVTRYFFSLVLAFSRLRFVIYLPSVAQPWLLWAHIKAFAFFGGVPQTILYDNPKTLVLRPRPDLVWHERLLAFASHYSFVPQACWPARAQTKGKIENTIGFHRRDFLLGLDPLPQDDADLNRRALVWCREVSDRICSTTGATPKARFEEERLYLRALPLRDFDCRAMETRRVLREALVAYEGSRYSVPARHVGELVTVKEDLDGTVHFYLDADEVAVHPRLSGRGQRSIIPEHHAPLWEAVRQLGKRRLRWPRNAPLAAEASVSLWRPSLVAVERRPLSSYQDLLEGRC